jgi:4-hydroxybenzoate polyprenyltransferase
MVYFSALRPKQWVKNFFIFLPIVFGGKLFEPIIVFRCIAAFFLFSFTASAVYIVNDLIDIKKDKLHPIKKLRPIAAGKISLAQAAATALTLGIISIFLSFSLDVRFGAVVLAYLLLNFIYSKFLKEVIIIDVFCVSLFFLLRIMAGSVVSGVELSHWIVFMIALLALFLGFNKRRQEIVLLAEAAKDHRGVLKKYHTYFIDQISSIVTSSIVVVYMLYTVDARTVKVYGTSHLIYTIPFVYYGIFRYLYILHDKYQEEGDPTRILLSDNKTQINVILWLATCIAVIYCGL